jgi:hypothetical protein
LGLAGSDLLRLTPAELPFYTTATGTSFSAPQVSGAIALMLEANPTLTPAKVREILQRTATPLAPYYAHETGAGMLNVHAAQSAPVGAMFIDVQPGGQFRPHDGVTRLAAAVALVRAAGLRTQAENQAGALLPFLDGLSIPHDLRGYVAVAQSRGFIQSDLWFHPNSPFTRGNLAKALAVVQNSAQ